MRSRIAIALCFITILAASLVYAQSPSPALGRVNIPFKFTIATKELPAGKYEVLKANGRETHLQFRNLQTNASIYVAIIERLAETDPAAKHGARVVFDTVGGQKILSEFWPANDADGYLLGINKAEEKHQVVEEK